MIRRQSSRDFRAISWTRVGDFWKTRSAKHDGLMMSLTDGHNRTTTADPKRHDPLHEDAMISSGRERRNRARQPIISSLSDSCKMGSGLARWPLSSPRPWQPLDAAATMMALNAAGTTMASNTARARWPFFSGQIAAARSGSPQGHKGAMLHKSAIARVFCEGALRLNISFPLQQRPIAESMGLSRQQPPL